MRAVFAAAVAVSLTSTPALACNYLPLSDLEARVEVLQYYVECVVSEQEEARSAMASQMLSQQRYIDELERKVRELRDDVDQLKAASETY
ncbi:hypothetical protein ACQKP1_15815 [Allorhizobium sp. NPDC080224]|uniref:hypothetical protein n=1 Tax=Allorhizobium sp. NPDC080224 TaxID=3390547 RepID=UPI003D06A668